MKNSLSTLLLIFITVASFGQPPSYVPTNGLLGWWAFTGNAIDSSGNGNNGTIINVQPTTDRFGITNCAYSFMDTSSKIIIPLQQNNILGYTLCAWFKTTVGGPIVTGRGASGQTGLSVAMHTNFTGFPGEIHFIADGPGTTIGKITDSTFFDGQWHQLVGVFNGSAGSISPSEFSLYIDTVLVSQTIENSSTATAPINNNTSILFGAHQVWPGGSFNGTLDDIGIWNRALSPSEIAQLYHPCIPASSPVISASNLMICEGDSTTITIAGGNLNNSFNWNWHSDSCGGTQTGSGNSINVSPSVLTSYFVRGEAGCSINGLCSSVTISVNPHPLVTATATEDTVCSGTSIILSGNGASSYSWTGPQVIQNNIPFTPNASGLFILVGNDTNGCSSIDSIAITVNTLPNVTLSLPFDTACLVNGSILLSGGSPLGGYYSGPGVDSILFNTDSAGLGTHLIQYQYTDMNGCSGSAVQQIVVDGCTGIGNYQSSEASSTVYPNPTTGSFTVEAKSQSIAEISIYNSSGQIVLHQMLKEQQIALFETPGLYLLLIRTTDGNYTKQCLIVE